LPSKFGDVLLSYDLSLNQYTIEKIKDEPEVKEFMITEISDEFMSNVNCWTGLITTDVYDSFSNLEDLLNEIS